MIGSSTDSIESLVVDAQRGSAIELERLLEICYPRLLRSAQRQVRDDDVAKDVVQETVIRISQNLSMLKNPQAFNSWTHRILKRCCCAHFSRENRHRLGEQKAEDLLLIDSASQLEKVDDDDSAALADAIETLGDKSREVVRLHYLLGLSVKEIAYRVRVSAGAVRVRLHRARNELRDLLPIQDEAI